MFVSVLQDSGQGGGASQGFMFLYVVEKSRGIYFDRENPALWTGAQFKGFALKDRPNPVMTSLGAGFINHTPPG